MNYLKNGLGNVQKAGFRIRREENIHSGKKTSIEGVKDPCPGRPVIGGAIP
jgi:hypothetical protein